MKDYYENMKNFKDGVAEQFEKADRLQFTQRMVDKIRLGRSVQGPIDGAGDEYGNYEKFENSNNQVKKVNDRGVNDLGYPVADKNIRDMFENMAHPDHETMQNRKETKEQQVVDETIKSTLHDDPELFDEYTKLKDVHIDNTLMHDQWQVEQEIFKDPEQASTIVSGRMSPQAKEELYRSYLQGTKVKDLSLKYGILPNRVKAIVYQKYLYWEEVYPRLGETHMRMAFDMEMIYARDYPFVNYGIDLNLMAIAEKGMNVSRLKSMPSSFDY